MWKGLAVSFVAAVMLAGCAGLQQFPDRSDGPGAKTLADLDKVYDEAVTAVRGESDPDKQRNLRNEFIERRLGVIDANFKAFVQSLAKGNVHADLLVELAEVGVGGAGALVSGGTSQIFSAISGGLAGGKAAYDKAALYDKTITALVAQMAATRQKIAVTILGRLKAGVDDYPMWLARQDLDAYEFAGSIPGAIVATADDAKVKADKAEIDAKDLLPPITKASVTPEMFELRDQLLTKIDGLSGEQAKALVPKVLAALSAPNPELAQYTDAVRANDPDGAKAKQVLKEAVLIVRTGEEAAIWQAAIAGL